MASFARRTKEEAKSESDRHHFVAFMCLLGGVALIVKADAAMPDWYSVILTFLGCLCFYVGLHHLRAWIQDASAED